MLTMAEKNTPPNRSDVCEHWTRYSAKKILEECNADLSRSKDANNDEKDNCIDVGATLSKTNGQESKAMVFDVDEHPLKVTWDSLNEWVVNAEKFMNELSQETAQASKLVAIKKKLESSKKRFEENEISPCIYVQDEAQIPKPHEEALQNVFVANKRMRLSTPDAPVADHTVSDVSTSTCSKSSHPEASWIASKLLDGDLRVVPKYPPSIPFLKEKNPPTWAVCATKNANVPYKHVLLGNAPIGASHVEILDALPPGWQPMALDGKLSSTEVELAYLQEESQHCQKREDFNFVWTYASPPLRMQLRMHRLVRPENYEAFERKRLEIRQKLLMGERRPLMGRIMAEYRLNFLKKHELSCAPTYEQIFGKEHEAIQLPIHLQNTAPRYTLASKSKCLDNKNLKPRSTNTTKQAQVSATRAQVVWEEALEQKWPGKSDSIISTTCSVPSTECQADIIETSEKKCRGRSAPCKPKKPNPGVIDGLAPIADIVLPRSGILTEEEQEVVWLGEESMLNHSDPKEFALVFVSAHASAKLKTLLPVRGGRWLPRVIRFHDPKVRVEYGRFRNEVRACLHSGFRRPETKAFLPADHIPLPSWTLTQMAYAEAFPN
jgi:hypothetical protein